MGVHHPDEGLCVQKAAQSGATDIGRSADFFYRLVKLCRGDTGGIFRLDEFAAPFRESIDNALAGFRLDAFAPIRAVNDVVGLQLEEIRNVVELFLGDDFGDTFELCDDSGALLVVHVREALVTGDCCVGEHADGDIAELGGLLDDVEMSGVNDVGRHRYINAFSHFQTLFSF